MGSQQYHKHKIASLIIVAAVAINSLTLAQNWKDYGPYYFLFMLSAVFDIFSHGLKESLVRSVPVNQNKFNLHVSVAQLISGLLLSPILLSISYNYDHYGGDSVLGQIQANQEPFRKFFAKYIELGFGCAFNFKQNSVFDDGESTDICQYVLFPLILYVISIFGLQVSIQTVRLLLV